MNICVCGWYFLDDFYASLLRANETYPVQIVANKIHPFLQVCSLPYLVRENTGLEWGAYNHYLMHLWKGGDVLFTHDDMVLQPIIKEYETLAPETVFGALSKLDIDHGYIFPNREADVYNYGMHGRMLFCSEKLLSWLKDKGGFWFDEKGDKPVNAGIHTNNFRILQSNLNVGHKIYAPSIIQGWRGNMDNGEKWPVQLAV